MPTDLILEKSLPHNLDAERCVLGAVLLDNAALNAAIELLKPEDFFLDTHRRIFDRMLRLSEGSRAIDLVTVTEELGRSGELEASGGPAYLSSLIDGVPRVSNIEHYARIVKEKAILRGLIHASNNIILEAMDGEGGAEEILDRAEATIFKIAEDRIKAGLLGIKEIVKSSFQTIDRLYERGQRITGLSTGYKDLDDLTSGLQRGDLVVVAGRPSMGKTAFALSVAQKVALQQGLTVGIFSLEMAKEQLLLRLLCSEAQVDSHKMRGGYLGKEDWGKLTIGLGRLAEAPIYIDDTPSVTVMEMGAKARRLKAERGLALLIVDYMQLVSGRGRFENRTQEISSISRGLKALAKELDLPVMAISQLSRAPEMRGRDHRPQLSDLRESGSIEQDADVVLFVFREALYNRDATPEERAKTELIIGKQRNGPIGKVEFIFLDRFTHFELASPTGAGEEPF